MARKHSVIALGILLLSGVSLLFLRKAIPQTPSSYIQSVAFIIRGTTSSIGGSALLLGACASGTATVQGATPGQVVKANTSDGTFLGSSFSINADVTSNNTVTVNVCAVVAGTPAAKTYNVVVNP